MHFLFWPCLKIISFFSIVLHFKNFQESGHQTHFCNISFFQHGHKPIHLASQNGHNESTRILLRAGSSPDTKNNVSIFAEEVKGHNVCKRHSFLDTGFKQLTVTILLMLSQWDKKLELL